MTTLSICPVCGIDVLAEIVVEDAVFMVKLCPIHGKQKVMIESSIPFYHYIQHHWTQSIYPGMLVDVTKHCNASCKWCFQKKDDSTDPSIETILGQAFLMPEGYPIILSGGEPTIRSDLRQIIEQIAVRNPVVTLTNGLNIDWDAPCGWSLSFHEETRQLFNSAVEYAIDNKKQFQTIIFTVDNKIDLLFAVDKSLSLKDVAASFRIHIAAPVGNDGDKPKNTMFVSEALELINSVWPVEIGHGKLTYLPVVIDGVDIRLISWAHKDTIDLLDLACPPYYYVNGRIDHLVTGLIRSEFYGKTCQHI